MDAELLERPATPTPPKNEDEHSCVIHNSDDDLLENDDSCESSSDNNGALVKTYANKSGDCKAVVINNRDATSFDNHDAKNDVVNNDDVTNDDDNVENFENNRELNNYCSDLSKIDKLTVNYKVDDVTENNNDVDDDDEVTDCENDNSVANENSYEQRSMCTADNNVKDFDSDEQSFSESSDDAISWKEGTEYDSDEYEIVEVEVTDAEESASENEQDDREQLEQQRCMRFRSESTICLKKTWPVPLQEAGQLASTVAKINEKTTSFRNFETWKYFKSSYNAKSSTYTIGKAKDEIKNTLSYFIVTVSQQHR